MISARPLRLCLPALLALAAAAPAACAQSRHMEARATSLAIDSPCVRSVTIMPDPALHGLVVLDATASHKEETAQLILETGPAAKLHARPGACWAFRPTLDIAIKLPPGMALTIAESGGAHYTLGAVGGALTLDITGGVELQAERIAALALDVSGRGSVTIGRVDGRVKGDISGGGDIRIDRANLPDLTLSISGGGAFALGKGTIGAMTLDISGAGSVHVGASVGDATIALSGTGDVRLAKVTGRLTKTVEGMGSVTIDTP